MSDNVLARNHAGQLFLHAHNHAAKRGWKMIEFKAVLGVYPSDTVPCSFATRKIESCKFVLNDFLGHFDLGDGKGEDRSLSELVDECERSLAVVYDDEEADRRIAANSDVQFYNAVIAFGKEHKVVASPLFDWDAAGKRRLILCLREADRDVIRRHFPDETIEITDRPQ